MTSNEHFGKSTWMLTLVSLAVVVAVLYLAKGVLVPLTLAAMLSFLLAPACDWLERLKLGRIPSVLLTAILAFTLLGVGTWTAALQMVELAPRIPEYQNNIQNKLNPINEYLSSALRRVTRSAHDIGQSPTRTGPLEESQVEEEKTSPVRVISAPSSPMEMIGGMFGSVVVMMGSIGVVIILVVFFLIRREDLRDRFIRLVGRGQVTATTQTLEDAATRVSRYLLTQLFINISFGIPIGIGLYLIGVPNAILWGILATVLRFIPYVGAWASAAPPIGLSLAISSGWIAPILTIGLFVMLELFISNVMEPWLYGKNTGVSSVAILVSAVFWTWLWGPVGLLLAVPLTVCLLVIGKHVPQLSFLDTLLGNEPVFELKKRVYQRLLAGDLEEAVELVESHLEQTSLLEVYDTVLIPALASAQSHWQRGDLDEERHKFMFQSMRETVEELGDREQELKRRKDSEAKQTDGVSSPADSTGKSMACILCLPARDEADEIAGTMLAQVLEENGCNVQSVSVTSLASEMVALVEEKKANIVCISAMPPAATTHARYLCKRLRGRFPDAHLIVGLWAVKGDLNKAKERIGCGADTHVVGTLAEAQAQIRRLVQFIPRPLENTPNNDRGPVIVQGTFPETIPEPAFIKGELQCSAQS
jgi:predicted PurR-regulated permease PerM/methylmalonyl-CoA mutase cobalamin-binding subunit